VAPLHSVQLAIVNLPELFCSAASGQPGWGQALDSALLSVSLSSL